MTHMNSGTKTAIRWSPRYWLLLGSVVALLAAPWAGSIHIACEHPDEGTAPVHDCDLCAKLHANPAVPADSPALTCDLRSTELATEPVSEPLRIGAENRRSRAPPSLDPVA